MVQRYCIVYHLDNKMQQILIIKSLKPENIWHFCLEKTDTVEAMTALGRQPKVGKCVCICVGGGGGGGGIQSAEAEIGQMVTVRFKGFACPL